MSVAYNPKIVTDGLVLYLDAANKKSYSGSGNTWIDLSSSKYTTTFNVNPTYSSTNSGYISYGTSNNYVTIPDFNLSNNFTFGCWINTTTVATCMFIARGNSTDTSGVYLSHGVTDPGYLRAGGNNGSGWNAGRIHNAIINDGKWHYIVGVYNQSSNTVTGFVDGIQGISNNILTFESNNYTPKNMKISKNQNSLSQFYTGNASGYIVYNRALSATEIQQNYNATKGRYGL